MNRMRSGACSCNKKVRLTLGSLIAWCGGESELSEAQRKKSIQGIWHDSRKVQPGSVFVALGSERDDGHAYVETAFKAGAVAAIVKKGKDVVCSAAYHKRLIRVNDPLKAVQKAAARYRKEMGILFVGITGSNGKTTTRAFISSVLSQNFDIGQTYGNFNNHIGVPLSILRFKGDEWVGIIEMGANHEHEIHELSRIVRPDIAVITNIGYGHIGLFGSLANTTSAKFEIADGLSRDGFMLLNGDDPRLVKAARERGLKSIFYGMSANCQIRADSAGIDNEKKVYFRLDGTVFRLSMPGRHFLYSALPAIYIGRRCGIPDEVIAEALASQKPLSMRGTVEMKNGVSFIIDCYNANPSSMKNAIAYLVDMSERSKRVAVVGDMLELGGYSKRLHRELGKDLAKAGVKKVIAIGAFASDVAIAAVKAGISARRVFTAEDSEQAVLIAKKEISEGDMVLLKGSRGVHLETLFEKF